MRTLLAFGVAILPLAPAAAQVASGGNYTVTLTVKDSGGGVELSGGNFSSRGAMGQDFTPEPGSGDILRGGNFEARQGFYNPPRLNFQNSVAGTSQDPSQAVSVTVASLSIPLAEYEIVFRQDPLNNPVRIEPSKIQEANSKARANEGPLAQVPPNHLWEISVMDERGFYDGLILQGGTIRFGYEDKDSDGAVDGTFPPVRAKTLDLWMLDEEFNMWVKVPDSKVDLVQKTVSAPLAHLSVYAFIGGSDADVDSVSAFPVPFRPYGPNAGTGPGQTGAEYTGAAFTGITFKDLPSEGKIEVYTLSGELVRRIQIPPNLLPARLSWDVKNESGEAAASGVYIWRVVSGANSKKGRLMVIR